ncbi:MAG: response regulator [Spongiibacteraceae bacterium]|jgi:DNA-binding response OmpR family regulator|nr:response regulator [Spongiibacteraceae bacterium]
MHAPSILVVEDDRHIAELIVCALEPEGFQLRHESSGRAGLNAALSRRPDLIITDYFMPNMGGMGMINALRADPETAGIPILMISAMPVDDDVPVAAALLKPFSIEELLATVANLVPRH